MANNTGSSYYMDLFVAWISRFALLLGLSFITVLVGCSRETAPNGAQLPPLIIGGGDRASETRNNQPPNTGGSYEKSDCAPYRKPGE